MGVPSVAVRHIARRRRRPRGGQPYNPLTAFSWKAAFYGGDPLWAPPADGDPVAAWLNGGSTRSEGAYLSTGAGLTLPGVSGNYASVPDEAALDITGDLDIRCKVALDDWTPATGHHLVGRLVNGNTTADAYALMVNAPADGRLRLLWCEGGTTLRQAYSSVVTGITDGQTKWVRATLDVDNGAGGCDVNFYLSDDGESWSQLGSTVTQAFTTSVYPGTYDMKIGANASLTGGFVAGNIYRAQVYDGIAGTKVLDVDFARSDVNKFTATTGQTVTVHNSLDASQATGTKQPAYRASVAALNDQPAVQGDGVDDFLQTANWTSALTQPVSVVVVGSVATAQRVLVDGNDTTNRILVYTPSGAWGLNAGALLSGGTSNTDPHLWVAYANGASSTLKIDGSTVASGNAGANSIDGVSLFSLPNGTSNNDGHIAFAGWIAGDITADANWPAFVAWVESEYGIAVA